MRAVPEIRQGNKISAATTNTELNNPQSACALKGSFPFQTRQLPHIAFPLLRGLSPLRAHGSRGGPEREVKPGLCLGETTTKSTTGTKTLPTRPPPLLYSYLLHKALRKGQTRALKRALGRSTFAPGLWRPCPAAISEPPPRTQAAGPARRWGAEAILWPSRAEPSPSNGGAAGRCVAWRPARGLRGPSCCGVKEPLPRLRSLGLPLQGAAAPGLAGVGGFSPGGLCRQPPRWGSGVVPGKTSPREGGVRRKAVIVPRKLLPGVTERFCSLIAC